MDTQDDKWICWCGSKADLIIYQINQDPEEVYREDGEVVPTALALCREHDHHRGQAESPGTDTTIQTVSGPSPEHIESEPMDVLPYIDTKPAE